MLVGVFLLNLARVFDLLLLSLLRLELLSCKLGCRLFAFFLLSLAQLLVKELLLLLGETVKLRFEHRLFLGILQIYVLI